MIKVAVVGAGHWGPNLVRSFRENPSSWIEYVCDTNKGRCDILSENYPEVQVISDYKTILSDADIDAVILSTPTDTHYSLGMMAIEAGKHLMVEKPLSVTGTKCKEMIDAAAAKDIVLFTGHIFKYNPGIRKVKEIIDSGELGEIRYITMRRTNIGPVRHDVSAMWDLAPHDISILSYWLENQPLSVSAMEGRFLHATKADMAILNFKFPDNILATIHVSWLHPRKTREIVVVAEKKMLVWDDLNLDEPVRIFEKRIEEGVSEVVDTFTNFYLSIKASEVVFAPQVEHSQPLAEECAHFIECIEEGKRPLPDGVDGLNVVNILQAADRSVSQASRMVDID